MGEQSCGILTEELKKRLEDVRRLGRSSMAYSSLQDDLEEFRHPDFKGFLAFRRVWGRAYILSNPVTDPKDYQKATDLFCRKFPFSVVCQASQDYAKILEEKGFYVTGFGVENILNLKNFQVSWQVRSNLKRILSRLSNKGLKVEEATGSLRQLAEINASWLGIKQNKKEFRFLARPFVCNEEQDVRFFILKDSTAVLGFCSWDPIYSPEGNGKVSSYVLQHLRVNPQAPRGAADFLIINILLLFQGQGYDKISLGLSPLYERAAPSKKNNFIIELFLNMFSSGSRFYRFKTVGEHKDRYHPEKEHTYLAYSKRADIIGHFGLLRVNGFI